MNPPVAMVRTLTPCMPLGVVGGAVVVGTNLNEAWPGKTPARSQGTAE